MKDKLKLIQEQALAAFQEAKEIKDIDDLKVKYLGKKGELTAVLKQMGKLSAEERLHNNNGNICRSSVHQSFSSRL